MTKRSRSCIAATTLKAKLERLIAKLIEARRQWAELTDDETPREKLGRPCSAAQLRQLEKVLGRPLPPSYRAFLELHNGWADFDGEAWILSVEEQRARWVRERVEEFESLAREAGEKNPFDGNGLPILIGPDEDNYVVMCPNRVRSGGEMELASFDLSEREERFSSFAAFLRSELKVVRELITDETDGASKTSSPPRSPCRRRQGLRARGSGGGLLTAPPGTRYFSFASSVFASSMMSAATSRATRSPPS